MNVLQQRHFKRAGLANARAIIKAATYLLSEIAEIDPEPAMPAFVPTPAPQPETERAALRRMRDELEGAHLTANTLATQLHQAELALQDANAKLSAIYAEREKRAASRARRKAPKAR